MYKPLIISILIHTIIFAADFGLSFKSDNNPAPKTKAQGLSVDLHVNEINPTESRRKSIKREKELINKKAEIKSKTDNSITNNNQSFSSNKVQAAVSFTGNEYKSWLMEYYSEILKLIKKSMSNLGVSAGNIVTILTINKNGIIESIKIHESDYNFTIKNKLETEIKNIYLPKFPDKLNKERISIKLKIVYE